jgi:hypothetical protein
MSAALDDFKRRFPDADVAREFLERTRWPNGVVCPFCTRTDKIGKITPNDRRRQLRSRPGQYRCYYCIRSFTVTVGTFFHKVGNGVGGAASHYEKKHPPMDLSRWLLAWWLLTVTTKPITIAQLARAMEVAYTTAWHVAKKMVRLMPGLDTSPLVLEKPEEPKEAVSESTSSCPPSTSPSINS